MDFHGGNRSRLSLLSGPHLFGEPAARDIKAYKMAMVLGGSATTVEFVIVAKEKSNLTRQKYSDRRNGNGYTNSLEARGIQLCFWL